jgi:hypothetical protein
MAASNYYFGEDPEKRLGDSPRYFYGIRRNAKGSLFLIRSDQSKDKETIQINIPGNDEDNFGEFEVAVDFIEGVDVNHNPVYPNMKYPQYRWDDRSIFYYVNDDGELVARINNGYAYPSGTSED